jgi:hypothetical protein
MESTYLNFERNVLEHHPLQYLQILGLFHSLLTFLNTRRLDLAIELPVKASFPNLHPLMFNVLFQKLNMYRWSDIQPKITLKGFEIIFCNYLELEQIKKEFFIKNFKKYIKLWN